MKLMIALAVLSAGLLPGCISIATHEEAMRRCRALSDHAEDLEKQNAELARNQQKSSQIETDLGEALKADVAAGDVKMEQTGANLTITLGDKVLFRSGQYELQPRGREVLAGVADILKKNDDRVIRVEGHTDNVRVSGPLAARFPSNWDLASARAAAVVRFLEKSGVDPARLVLTAYGDHRPVGDNSTVEGRASNRRVEITLTPQEAVE